ncbi:hypothetical protein [Streptomyces klenkii]|uniref:hypothetical protein n=1 Tax=Streptomyces klenkii TaxID=1420899 RepID=UPI0034448142
MPDGDTLKTWITRYATVLAETCSLTSPDITAVLTESLIPPDGTITADMLYALRHLQAEGTAPEGLAPHLSSLAPTAAQPLKGGLSTFNCTRCNRPVHIRTAAGLFTLPCSSCHAGNLVKVS